MCKFWMKQVSSFSHVISKEGISVNLSKIQDMLSWNALARITDIHSLLGLVGYYQRLVKEISKITKPMIELLGKVKKFK
jgi:hypothetical protein